MLRRQDRHSREPYTHPPMPSHDDANHGIVSRAQGIVYRELEGDAGGGADGDDDVEFQRELDRAKRAEEELIEYGVLEDAMALSIRNSPEEVSTLAAHQKGRSISLRASLQKPLSAGSTTCVSDDFDSCDCDATALERRFGGL